ncbi:MAG: hypothetical protein ACR2HZ_09965 [Gemmatimonadaceae bacterium]
MSLRPRTAPELVDAAVSLARSTYGRLITLATLAYLPTAIVRLIGLRPSADGTVQAVDLFLIVHDLVWQSLGWAAILVVLAQRYLTDRADLGVAIRTVHGDAWRITILGVLSSLLVYVGLALFIVPGLYFMVRFFAIPQTLLFERTTLREALLRSLSLSRHDQLRLAVASAIALAIGLALWWGIAAAVEPLVPAKWHADLIAGAVQLFIEPFLAAVWLLFYFDVRMRIEGFDVQREMEGTAPIGG